MIHSKQEDRKKDFKKKDVDAGLRKREEYAEEIRKAKRFDQQTKRRQTQQGLIENPSSPPVITPFGAVPVRLDPALQQKLLNLPTWTQMIMSEDLQAQLDGTTQLRKILSIERNPPIQQVIEQGVVGRFVQFLHCHDRPQLQFEAAWAVTNVASGTPDQTRLVIESGAVPVLVQLLMSQNEDVREQAVWALGNIAGDSPLCRDFVLASNALPPLLHIIAESKKMTMLRNATWTLSNFCRGKPQPAFDVVKPALPALAHLVSSSDDEVLIDACWALSYLSDGPNERIQAVINAGVVRRMVELLQHPNPAVQTPALRTVGNIVTGDDVQTQMVLGCSALRCLVSLLSSPKKTIRKEACWTISNVTAGNKAQIQAVIDEGLIPPVLHLLNTSEFDIKKEAAWAISNATSGGTPDQIRYLVREGCIGPLLELLGVPDVKIVTVALEGLENVLKVGDMDASLSHSNINDYAFKVEEAGGLDRLEALEKHPNQEIYRKAYELIENYFGEDEDQQIVAPQQIQGQYQFGVVQQPVQYNFGDMQ